MILNLNHSLGNIGQRNGLIPNFESKLKELIEVIVD
jgi:hypothetical protein